jgi:hypothetical protein
MPMLFIKGLFILAKVYGENISDLPPSYAILLAMATLVDTNVCRKIG